MQRGWYLTSFYDYISSPEGKAVIASGWKKLGIFDTVELGLSNLPVLDPFNDICPLMEVIPPKEMLSLASLLPLDLELYKTKVTDEIDEDKLEWEVDDADEDSDMDDQYDHDMCNVFDMFGEILGKMPPERHVLRENCKGNNFTSVNLGTLTSFAL